MDLDLLLKQTGRVTDAPAALAAGRAALDDATARGTARVIALKRRRHRRAALGSLVAAAAAAVVAVPAVGLRGAPTASAGASQVLLQAGRSAGAQPGDWQSAAYWHSVSRHHQGNGPTFTREIWIGHHEPGVLKDPGVDTGVLPLEVALFPAGGTGISWDGLWSLPTDPDALEHQLRDGINGAGNGDDSELFVIVGDLLRESPAPPVLRKALWEVAARVPGVRLVGEVTDGAGRAGVAVERQGQRYVLDPDTGKLLEETEATWSSTYLDQGPADNAPAATHVEPDKQGVSPGSAQPAPPAKDR
jgi:hypothetical protein